MSIDFVKFNTRVTALVADANDRRKVVAAVAAQLIADCVDLPTEPTNSVENYYLMNVKSQVIDKLGKLNEKLIMDVTLAKDYVRKYWLLRYNCAFPGANIKRKTTARFGYFDTVMGVGQFIDDEHHQFVNQYKNEILTLCVDLEDLVKE